MDPIFDRLDRLFRAAFQTDTDAKDYRSADPDMADAMDELNDFLNDDPFAEEKAKQRAQEQARQRSGSAQSQRPGGMPETLRQDFENLGVPFATKLEDVTKAHRLLILKYHPDRNNATPEALKKATETSSRINASFQKIKAWYETGKF